MRNDSIQSGVAKWLAQPQMLHFWYIQCPHLLLANFCPFVSNCANGCIWGAQVATAACGVTNSDLRTQSSSGKKLLVSGPHVSTPKRKAFHCFCFDFTPRTTNILIPNVCSPFEGVRRLSPIDHNPGSTLVSSTETLRL